MKANNKLFVNMQRHFYGMVPDNDLKISMLIERDGIKINEVWLALDEVLRKYVDAVTKQGKGRVR